MQHSSAQTQGTGRYEGRGHGEEEQGQQLEEASGQQHVATVDQYWHRQHHIGQQPAEECHPREPRRNEGWPRHLYLLERIEGPGRGCPKSVKRNLACGLPS